MSDFPRNINPADVSFNASEISGENQDSITPVESDKDGLTPQQRKGLDEIVTYFSNRISYINIEDIDEYFSRFDLPNSILNSPEIQKLAKNLILECFRGNLELGLRAQRILEFKERLNYTNPDEEVLKKIKDKIIRNSLDFDELSSRYDLDGCMLFKNIFSIEFSKEDKKSALDRFEKVLPGKVIEDSVELADFLKKLYDLEDDEIFDIIKTRIVSTLDEAQINGKSFSNIFAANIAADLIVKFKVPTRIIKIPKIQRIISDIIDFELGKDIFDKDGDPQSIQRILVITNIFLIEHEKFLQIAKSNIIYFLEGNNILKSYKIIESFNLEELLKSPEIIEAGKNSFINIFKKVNLYSSINFQYLPILIDDFKIPDKEVIDILGQNDNLLDTMCAYLDITTLKELCDYTQEYSQYLDWLKKNNLIWQFSLDEIKQAKQLNFNIYEAHVLGKEELGKMTKTNNTSEEKPFEFIGKMFKKSEKKESPNERDKKVFEKFSAAGENMELPDWQDKVNITTPFKNAAEIFGYDKMFAYCAKANLSRHDALHNFDKIILVYQASGLSAKLFYNNILSQVSMDGANYESGMAPHELNSIANNINLNFQATIERASQYKDIASLQKLLVELSDTNKIFTSWKNLKKYAEICQLLGKKEILDQLSGLKTENPALASYVEVLAFHPNINMQAVLQFWKTPDVFLGISDKHTNEVVHDRKKPSNYTNIPNLDLSAENMRDALVDGDLDVIQTFKPLEIRYEFKDKNGGKILDYVKLALGSRKDSVVGKAQDVSKLFDELKKVFKDSQLDFMKFFRGEMEVSTELSEKIEGLVFDRKFGLSQAYKNPTKNNRYRAKINLKSDPDGAVAGNDTACCMPFGSGKNNVYTFNPVCSLFTVQLEVEGGQWRTVAQSVLTKDKDVKKDISVLVEEINKSEQKLMSAVLSDDILLSSKATLACDNVEVSKNSFVDERVLGDIEAVYRDFFKEYLSKYAEEDGYDASQVVIGLGFSDSLANLPRISNTFLPLAPVGYSDQMFSQTIQLIPESISAEVKKSVIESEKKIDKQDNFSSDDRTVTSLTFEDSLAVAYLESKAYADNSTLIQSLHNMENALIAKDINNVAKKRKNLSLKHTNRDGRVDGYMLAYEGKSDQNITQAGEVTAESKPIIYVSDIAADTTVKGVGRELMINFLKLYKINYLDKGNSLPILAQAREKTSYLIIKNKLAEYAKLAGINVELEIQEIGSFHSGYDVMHELIIKVK